MTIHPTPPPAYATADQIAARIGVARETLLRWNILDWFDSWQLAPNQPRLWAWSDVHRLVWWRQTRKALRQLHGRQVLPPLPESLDTLLAWFEEAEYDQECPECGTLGVGDDPYEPSRVVCEKCGVVEFSKEAG